MLNKAYDWLVLLTTFSAPALALTVPGVGSANYKLLILLGLITGWRELRLLNKAEITIFLGLFLLFVTNLASFSQTQELDQGIKWLSKYLLLFLGVFAYALIKPRMSMFRKYIDFFLVLNAMIIGIVAVYQYFVLGLPRVMGSSHPILFGDVAIALFAVILVRLVIRKRGMHLMLAALACLMAAVLTSTRGAVVAVPVLLVFLFWLHGASFKVKAFLGVLVVSLVVASILPGSPLKSRVEYTISDLRNYSENKEELGGLSVRFEIWRHAVSLWKLQPILGIGPGDFNIEMRGLVDSGKIENPLEVFYGWTSHSNVVNALLTSGIVGLVFYILSLFLIPAYWAIKTLDANGDSLFLISVLVVYFIFGLTTTWIASHAGFSMFMLFFLVSLAHMNELSGRSKESAVPDEEPLI